ncbi:DUF4389 domain-containing protein [Patulibacter sp. SYSU D01012]|uniref:DUF4389 domain-containing protein n=1 Tax=Patulibacter sp. SYSU D01012 TaxID=2817381 RepID=UPI001B315798
MLPPGTVAFVSERRERHSRLTAFFRWLLVIPHLVYVAVYGFVAFFGGIVAWLALVVTGRYPEGLYRFMAGYARVASRVNAYAYLLDDRFPPFAADDASSYPSELRIGPPKTSYSRLLAFFRWALLIPVWLITYVLSVLVGILAFVGWVVVIVLGRMPEGLHNAIAFCVSYLARGVAYGCLLTEDFPGFDGSVEAAEARAAARHDR